MIRTIALLAVLGGALLSAPNAQASTLIAPDGSARVLYQRWIDSSALPVPSDPITVTLRNCRPTVEACMEHDGITFPDIAYLADTTVYGTAQIESQRTQFMHEVFHVLDTRLDGRGGYREAFRRIMGYAREGAYCWARCGFVARSEIAADAYAFCATRPHVMPRDNAYKGYGLYRPTDGQHERVCHMFDTRLS